MSVAIVGVGWASVAQIEEAIPAQGKLEPEGAVKDVQVPVNGVVKTVHVQDGQRVKPGDLLLTLDPNTPKAQETSLKAVRDVLLQENQYYQDELDGQIATPKTAIPAQMLSLTKSRQALMAERQFVRSQLDGTIAGLNETQLERLESNQAELESRATTTKLEGAQFDRQLAQTQVRLQAAEKTLAVNEKILNNITALAQSGGISQIQFLEQQQKVDNNRAEIAQLEEELNRIQLQIAESASKVRNTIALDRRDSTRQLAEIDQRIAEIDSQLTKAIVENRKRISEIDSQLVQTQQTLQYGEIRATVEGTVFDLKARTPGFVATTTEPILKIVPQEALVAKVSITNQDIGFVREGMTVDVRIDSFPFSEFGDVKGKVVWIGSDAIPPTQIQPFYTFPAKIKLDRQTLQVGDRSIRLQSGMSLMANIKLRKRTIMSIFTDQFTKMAESLNHVR
ncbi:HlyD family efflux transporter periplasmic adaptor subunit [Pseudanabaenaceae cyanobacterium LEGE 13415]|nr:HlyD family efflux transporter periplasmic adaptor subunit [Pseudanabaenaceae cyanobacterium LEGE 13415]